LRIVPSDLARELVEHAVVADPVRHGVAAPGAALWTVVVRSGRPHFPGEPRLPVDPFRAIGNAVGIWNPQPGMPADHLVDQLVSANIEATPVVGNCTSSWTLFTRATSNPVCAPVGAHRHRGATLRCSAGVWRYSGAVAYHGKASAVSCG